MASIDKRKGAWRVQVRRGRRSWNKTFRVKADGEAWAREIESAADRGVDPLASRITTKDSFASLINRHMDDLATYGKPLRRSKESVLRRLEAELEFGRTVLERTWRRDLPMTCPRIFGPPQA